jgi:thioredoxin-like negative regulator of GroEL
VRGIPALHLFANGKPVAQRAGLVTADAIGQWLTAAAASPRR